MNDTHSSFPNALLIACAETLTRIHARALFANARQESGLDHESIAGRYAELHAGANGSNRITPAFLQAFETGLVTTVIKTTEAPV